MITCCAAAAMLVLSVTARQALAVDMEQLHDLTGGAVPVVTLEGHDTFSNEYVYSVKVINRTGDPIVADTLVVVLSSLQDPSGKDVLESIEVVNPAGTIHGRPYFLPREPAGQRPPSLAQLCVVLPSLVSGPRPAAHGIGGAHGSDRGIKKEGCPL